MNAPTSAAWASGGTVDGRYRVIGELGRGGMGIVHRVRHLAWGIDMAVKSSRPELFRRPGDQELFVREAEARVPLGLHPNVCACHYVRVIDGVPRVFAEYVEGGSLAEWIGEGQLYAGTLGRSSPAYSKRRSKRPAGLSTPIAEIWCTRT